MVISTKTLFFIAVAGVIIALLSQYFILEEEKEFKKVKT